MTKERITVRVSESQLQVLNELKNTLNCNISLIIRAIIGDFIQRNENIIEEIISGNRSFDKDWMKK